MSSTNRGSERHADDLYETPSYLIEAFIPQLVKRFLAQEKMRPRIWEPCAGNGRIVRVLKHHFPHANIVASDIQEYPGLDFVGDFLVAKPGLYPKFDLILSNPPFKYAAEIVQHAPLFLKPGGVVVMLERLNFLGSRRREPFLSKHVPDVALSPRRASFLPTRLADSIEYGFFSWELGSRTAGQLTYLDTMTCDKCDVHYEKICPRCDYGHCEEHKDHECKLFGAPFLWGCANHPDVGMAHACKTKVKGEGGKTTTCGLPLCAACWAEHTHEA